MHGTFVRSGTHLSANPLNNRDDGHDANFDNENARPEGILSKDGIMPGEQLNHGGGHAWRRSGRSWRWCFRHFDDAI